MSHGQASSLCRLAGGFKPFKSMLHQSSRGKKSRTQSHFFFQTSLNQIFNESTSSIRNGNFRESDSSSIYRYLDSCRLLGNYNGENIYLYSSAKYDRPRLFYTPNYYYLPKWVEDHEKLTLLQAVKIINYRMNVSPAT